MCMCVILDAVRYEYMALAKNTTVLREAMLLFFEPVSNITNLCTAEYVDIFMKPC